MSEESEIIEAIKEARSSKGLTQRALSKLTGVTQAHISNIENGGVDIQLSSLTQIVRALDLEVRLVPRKSLPAVDTIIKSTSGFPRNRTNVAISEIRKVENFLDHLLQNNNFENKIYSNDIRSSIDRLNQNLSSLKSLNYDTSAYVQLKKILSSTQKIENIFGDKKKTLDFFENNKLSKELEKFRNTFVHSQFDNRDTQLSLYSLENEND